MTKPWTSSEIKTLKENSSIGVQGLAILLERSETSIKQFAHRNRISLRCAGNSQGLLLGQRRGKKWMDQVEGGISSVTLAEIKKDALAGTFDLTTMEIRISRRKSGKPAPLCPNCVARPQEHASSGLCGVCHLRSLAQLHRENHKVTEANRELWRTKQEASRIRRAAMAATDTIDLEDQ